jgi:hypothetical protein
MQEPEHVMQFFEYAHLPPHLREVSQLFGELAAKVAELPPSPERTKALDRLLEAKDAAVRAKLTRPQKPHPEATWCKVANRWFEPGQGPAIRGTPLV